MGDSAVFVVWLDLLLGPDAAGELYATLSDDEKARVSRLATEELRRRATARFARRREALGHVLDVPAHAVQLARDDRGRPLAHGPQGTLTVSSSSSGDVGLLAIAPSHVVGVDVEATSEMVDGPRFIDRVATARERGAIAGLVPSERRSALGRLWTRKEAYLKATGEGIGAGIAHVEVPLDEGLWNATFQPLPGGEEWLLYDLDPPFDGFTAALVVAPGWTMKPEIVTSRG